MNESIPAAMLEVEVFALAHAMELGRGLVVLAIDGALAELCFVPLEAWKADPLPCYTNDARIARWLAEYDPKTQYILIRGIRNGDEMSMRPFCMAYVLIMQMPTAVTA